MSATVRLANGVGLVARRATELLFVPTAAADLVEVFDASLPGDGIDAVTRLAEERAFDVDDFVAVDWSAGIRIAVFGDVEVVSDHRSLPRLSASGVGTWVERSLRAGDAIVTLGVAPDEVQPLTDLRHGVVQAGGFALTCVPGAPALDDHAPSSRRLDAAAARSASEPSTPDSSPTESSGGESGAETQERVAVATPATSAAPAPVIDDQPPPVVTETVVASAVDALADQVLNGVPPRDREDFAAAPDDVTIVPDPVMQSQIDELVDRSRAVGPALPPLPPLPGEEPASNWQLVFADGATERVDRTLVLGRKPAFADGQTDADTRLVPIDCSQVSGRHLEVRSEGSGIAVTDLGSSNGSFVLTTGDGQLVRLDPGVSHRIDVGMIVQIGTKRFRAEAMSRG